MKELDSLNQMENKAQAKEVAVNNNIVERDRFLPQVKESVNLQSFDYLFLTEAGLYMFLMRSNNPNVENTDFINLRNQAIKA